MGGNVIPITSRVRRITPARPFYSPDFDGDQMYDHLDETVSLPTDWTRLRLKSDGRITQGE